MKSIFFLSFLLPNFHTHTDERSFYPTQCYQQYLAGVHPIPDFYSIDITLPFTKYEETMSDFTQGTNSADTQRLSGYQDIPSISLFQYNMYHHFLPTILSMNSTRNFVKKIKLRNCLYLKYINNSLLITKADVSQKVYLRLFWAINVLGPNFSEPQPFTSYFPIYYFFVQCLKYCPPQSPGFIVSFSSFFNQINFCSYHFVQ